VPSEHLALDWLDADVAPGEARLASRQQRLVEQTADVELVARLLAEPGVDPNAAASVSDSHGVLDPYTPLTRAAALGHLEAVRLLLEAGADPGGAAPSTGWCRLDATGMNHGDSEDSDGTTPLMAAAGFGQLEVLRLLLARGAAVDAMILGERSGITAFHCACVENQAECAEELMRAGCDSPGRCSHFDTTLYISLVILHAKYTGWCQNDFNVYA
jgi:ankyrin repeat protein